MMDDAYKCDEDFRAHSLDDAYVVEMSLTEVEVNCPCCSYKGRRYINKERVSRGEHQSIDHNGHYYGRSVPCTLCQGVGQFTYTRKDA